MQVTGTTAPDLNSIKCRQPVLQCNALQCRHLAAPPIKCGLGYRSRTLNPNRNPNPKTDPNPNRTLKVTIMYAV